jgi:prepilin-type processing-associated H-X9-DG protein
VILAGLLLPALARAKAKGQGIVCLNNSRQLTLGWILYADDQEDRLVYNLGADRSRHAVITNWDANWVNNVMTWELEPDNTNTAFVSKAKLTPYVGLCPSLYRCPADHVLSDIQKQAGWFGRVRSISMNAMVGDVGDSLRGEVNLNNPEYQQFLKLGQIPHPDRILVFLDEHPDSINDGYFINKPDEREWVDLPASYHNGGAGISFADGHSETHQWVHRSTKRPNQPDATRLPFPLLPNEGRDFEWVAQRTSVER